MHEINVQSKNTNKRCSKKVRYVCLCNTIIVDLRQVCRIKLFFMTYPTIEELLTSPEEIRELAGYLDHCMLYLVLYLKYEPEQLEKIVECYDNISLLKQAIQHHQIKS